MMSSTLRQTKQFFTLVWMARMPVSPALYVTLMCFPVTITPIILPMVTVV